MSPKEELAEDRTELAEDRTMLAAERTFSGWIRTGLAAAGVAIGLHAVFGPFQPTWVPKAAATAFLVAAQVIFVGAWLQNRRSRRRLSNEVARLQPRGRIALLVLLLSAGNLAIGIVVWFI